MIHPGRTSGPLMLDVAAAAVLNVGMECGWLLAEVGSGSGMARDAGSRFHAPGWRVTRFALVAEEGVLHGEGPGLEEALPTRYRCRSRAVEGDDSRYAAHDSDGDQRRIKKSKLLHESHRRP